MDVTQTAKDSDNHNTNSNSSQQPPLCQALYTCHLLTSQQSFQVSVPGPHLWVRPPQAQETKELCPCHTRRKQIPSSDGPKAHSCCPVAWEALSGVGSGHWVERDMTQGAGGVFLGLGLQVCYTRGLTWSFPKALPRAVTFRTSQRPAGPRATG